MIGQTRKMSQLRIRIEGEAGGLAAEQLRTVLRDELRAEPQVRQAEPADPEGRKVDPIALAELDEACEQLGF